MHDRAKCPVGKARSTLLPYEGNGAVIIEFPREAEGPQDGEVCQARQLPRPKHSLRSRRLADGVGGSGGEVEGPGASSPDQEEAEAAAAVAAEAA
eukprot:12798925-Alexandrium_andersonii.AAC.1